MSMKDLRRQKTDPALTGKRLARLYEALLSLKNKEECAAFLRDLCTESELEAFGERLAIAERLAKDESYLSIAGTVGASTTTVTRVAHWMNHGRGGYPLVIQRLQKK
jgi:TrpR-related protein YerC/YecD